jgi:hypothetical protein
MKVFKLSMVSRFFTKQSPVKLNAIKHVRPFELMLNCHDCRYSRLENNQLKCILFRYDVLDSNELYYIDTDTCRSDIQLCGPHGEYFKIKNIKLK